MIQYRNMMVWLLLGLLFFALVYVLRGILLPFILGMMIAYFLDPVADELERQGWKRSWATGLVLVAFFTTLTGIILLLSPLLYHQIIGFVQSLPEIIATTKQTFNDMMRSLSRLFRPADVRDITSAIGQQTGSLGEFVGTMFSRVLHSGMALFSFLSLLLLTPLVAFYCLRDWDRMLARIDSLLPRQHAPTIRQQAREIDRVLSGFLRGQLIVCAILGSYYAIALSLVGLKYGLLIGLGAGVLAFIPYVGTFIGGVVAVGVAFVQFDGWEMPALVLGIYAFGQFVEGNFIAPKIIGDRVGLHPAWVIFGMLAGGALLGFLGVLIALPVTAVIGVLVRFAVARYEESGLYLGEVTPSAIIVVESVHGAESDASRLS